MAENEGCKTKRKKRRSAGIFRQFCKKCRLFLIRESQMLPTDKRVGEIGETFHEKYNFFVSPTAKIQDYMYNKVEENAQVICSTFINCIFTDRNRTIGD